MRLKDCTCLSKLSSAPLLLPDIIVCDVMMPVISGFEVCSNIRKEKELVDVKIVMSSAKAYEADRNKAKKMGADAYIVKPFTMAKFSTVMQTLGSMQLSACIFICWFPSS